MQLFSVYVTVDGATGTLTIHKAGTASVTVIAAETQTYARKTKTITVTINRADITPTVSLEGWTYGGTAKTPSVDGNSGNGAVTYTYATKGSTEFAATVPTEAGDYTVKANIAATTNYNSGTATADFTIAKASITPTVSLDGWTYGGTAKTPSVDGNSGNGAVTYTYATKGSTEFAAIVPTEAGDYTVMAAMPSARSGIETIAPSGKFWMAMPSARASAAVWLTPTWPDAQPAYTTPTAMPSGILCSVTASMSLVVRFSLLRGPSL